MEKKDLVTTFNRQIIPETKTLVGGEISADELEFIKFSRSNSGFSRSVVRVRGKKFKIKGGGKETTFVSTL